MNQIAKGFFRLEDLERAEFYFLRSLEIQETPETLFFLGLLADQKKHPFLALNYFRRSVMNNPDYGNPYNEIGVILLRQGKYRESMFWLKKSLQCSLHDAPHVPLYNLAALYKIWNRPERSLQYLYRALHVAPEFSEAIQLRDEILAIDS